MIQAEAKRNMKYPKTISGQPQAATIKLIIIIISIVYEYEYMILQHIRWLNLAQGKFLYRHDWPVLIYIFQSILGFIFSRNSRDM